MYSYSAFGQWEECNSIEFSLGFVNSLYTSGQNIYLGTYSGLFKSSDNGDSWENTNNISMTINRIGGYGNEIIAGTKNGSIYVSSNNQKNWTSVQIGDEYEKVNALLGFDNKLFVGTSWGMRISSDGGKNWSGQTFWGLTKNCPVLSLCKSGTKVLAGGFEIYYSTNNGKNWDHYDLSDISSLSGIDVSSMVTNGDIIYASTIEGLYITSDNGNKWILKATYPYFEVANCMIFVNNKLFAASDRGIHYSTDHGDSWISITGNLHEKIYSLAFNNGYLFAAAYGVYRAKLSDLGITGVEEETAQAVTAPSIFPNPAGEYIEIKALGLEDFSPESVRICNSLGQSMNIKLLSVEPLRIDVSGLAPGVYCLQAGDRSEMFVKK